MSLGKLKRFASWLVPGSAVLALMMAIGCSDTEYKTTPKPVLSTEDTGDGYVLYQCSDQTFEKVCRAQTKVHKACINRGGYKVVVIRDTEFQDYAGQSCFLKKGTVLRTQRLPYASTNYYLEPRTYLYVELAQHVVLKDCSLRSGYVKESEVFVSTLESYDGKVGSYSSYPSYPSYPSCGTYPIYPSYPSYVSYPSHPSSPSYPSYPSYPSQPFYPSYP